MLDIPLPDHADRAALLKARIPCDPHSIQSSLPAKLRKGDPVLFTDKGSLIRQPCSSLFQILQNISHSTASLP